MVPLHLRLRNFLSYGVDGGELDLTPIHLACLSGGNGNGKSALVDAMTWSLWGRSRAAREDDLLRHGTTEMEVEFEFACNHAVYRVIRKRSVRKNSSIPTLELTVRDGDAYRSISGNSVGETEKAIADILRLSFDTFINSSLLLQGRADLFTTKRPAERKEILAEILGLGQYEVLAENARARERDLRVKADQRRLRVEELDRFLAGVPAIRDQVAGAQSQLEAMVIERGSTEQRLQELDSRSQALLNLKLSLQRHEERVAAIQREEAEICARLKASEKLAATAQGLLADETSIRARAAALQDARLEGNRLGQLMVQLRALEHRAAEANQIVAGERARLTADLRAAEANARVAREAEVALAGLESELQQVRLQADMLPKLQAEREAHAAELSSTTERLGGLRASVDALTKRCNELREKIVQLRRADAVCPTCGGPLDGSRRDEAINAAMREGIQSKEEIDRVEAQLLKATAEQKQRQHALEAADSAIREVQRATRRDAELSEKARALQAQVQQLVTLDRIIGESTAVLRSEQYALDARAALATVALEIAALGYSDEAHSAVVARIKTLAGVEAQVQALERARADLQKAELAGTAATAQLQSLVGERERIAAEEAPLKTAIADLPAVQKELADMRAVLQQRRAAEDSLHKQIGALQNQLEEAGRRTEERARTADDLTAAEKQAWALHELAAIFGKRGIQAMLIENALPELEQDANELLARMTDNSTQVKFATQRQGTGGRAIETLEIQIADTMGTRTYEMFSGGEAFRINFAIRIALSKLLARYAGADLSFLLIDEGFGTQDVQGRDRLVEAISAIADDFEKILVVTHIDELKDQFDVHIEVNKGPAGSQITVAAT